MILLRVIRDGLYRSIALRLLIWNGVLIDMVNVNSISLVVFLLRFGLIMIENSNILFRA